MSMVCTEVPAGTRSMKALSAILLNDAWRRLPQNATSFMGSDIARFLSGYGSFVSTKAGGYIEAAGRTWQRNAATRHHLGRHRIARRRRLGPGHRGWRQPLSRAPEHARPLQGGPPRGAHAGGGAS